MHFHEWKESNLQHHSIGLDNGLAPNRRQAVIWTNADPIHWRIYLALGGEELSLLIRHLASHAFLWCQQCQVIFLQIGLISMKLHHYSWQEHYSDVTWVSWCLIPLPNQLFVQQLVQVNNKENIKASYYCLFVMGIYLWLVDSPHKGP